jgi:hypothetical protein
MLTGRTSALRFGIILGLALLAAGISSLRMQRNGGRHVVDSFIGKVYQRKKPVRDRVPT